MLAAPAPYQHPTSGLPALLETKLNGVDSDMENAVQVRWHFAGSAGQAPAASKTLVALVRHQQLTSGRLAFIFPEGEEGVNTVNNPIPAVGVGVKDLGVAIDPDHSGATV